MSSTTVQGNNGMTSERITNVVPPNPVSGHTGVRFSNVTHWFVGESDANLVLENISFEVPDGEFVAIVGASGCGKTTILNMIAGLYEPTEGTLEVSIGEKRLALPSKRVGYMWARDALLPWRSLLRNVEFGLELRKVPRSERRAKAEKYLTMTGLAGNYRKFPAQLSHGMRQRANLARLLAIEPEFLLMDEPFSALDAQTKAVLQQEFSRIWEANVRTTVYVTHDLTEACLLADRVIVMGQGYLAYDLEVPFERPRNLDELRFAPDFQSFSHDLWLKLQHAKEGGRQ